MSSVVVNLLTKEIIYSQSHKSCSWEKPTYFSYITNQMGQTYTICNDFFYFMILGVWVCLITIYGLVSIGSVYGNGLVLWIVSTTKSLQNVNNLLVANLAITGKNLTIKFYKSCVTYLVRFIFC